MSIKKRAQDMWVSDLVDRIEKLEEKNRELIEENDKLKSDLDRFSEAYKKYRDFDKEELAESCYDFARENKKLKEELDGYKM